MADRLEALTGALLSAARAAGATSADAMATEGTAISADVRQGRLEQAERAEGVEIGLRVFVGHRQACVSASDQSARTIAEMAERAVAMAREAPEDDTAGLADPSQLAKGWDLAALELTDPADDPSAAALEAAARAAEAAALGVQGVTQVEAGAAFSRRSLFLAASNGFAGGYGRSSHSLSAMAITGEGLAMERDWAAESRAWGADMPSPEEIGQRAGDRAVSRAGARRPKTGAYPVLFDERISASLVGHLLSAVNGMSIVRGASWLRDALGQQVLPKGMSITEDPTRPRLTGSRPFDGEGLATGVRAIVADGVLTGWTLDLATARRLGMQSTASASRNVSSPPAPGNGNIALTQGVHSREDLLSDMGTGLLVTGFIGASINPNTGDYSRGVSGFWVEKGEITYPVNECTIAGNLRDMLLAIVPANDARTHLSHVVPSLLVAGLTLAGE
ncbi:TldD/PmbA family protein [Frigidibacter sp. SD6-1]|uniref:TldD/PmbA family protein n=1 Tax=Frigidibacter sp. SD6-1 TaxID=3032581 RepID=UPI0024DF4162|nr:TldD/PmbA family protein [Frigidibacter sp. SD6-1]